MLVRADCGGLGAMTWDAAQHLRPDRIVIVDMGSASRGPFLPERYAGLAREITTVRYPITDPGDILAGIDVLYTAEVPYGPTVLAHARARGVRVVLHAMTELWQARYAEAAEVWLPTPWVMDRVLADCEAAGIKCRVMPVPVNTERIEYRRRDRTESALHIAAPAMLDRNGTELVLDAYRAGRYLPPMTARHVPQRLAATVGWTVANPVATHYDGWQDADLLVMPRRYAGLCLPVLEAAAAGIPTVMLDRAPENEWPGVATVPARITGSAEMAGGTFLLHGCEPGHLAWEIRRLCGDRAAYTHLAGSARAWAQGMAWTRWTEPYREALESA
jgi:hypothetical protein